MRPEPEALREAYPHLDAELVREHLERLDDRYFERFDLPTVARHLKRLGRLSADNPVELLIDTAPDGSIACTILGFDHDWLFSLIAGVLAATGYSIRSGDVFTYRKKRTSEPPSRRRRRGRRPPKPPADALQRRRIVDHFAGELLQPGLPFENWKTAVELRLHKLFGLLEESADDALARAKHMVNKMVAERLDRLSLDLGSVLYPVSMALDNDGDYGTRLKVTALDTPAFLYALCHALSIHRVTIERVVIRTIESRVEDEIEFVDQGGNKVVDPEILNRIRLSVLLTKQFTYFISRAPDPYVALERFESLVHEISILPEQGKWLDLLSNPGVLRDLARLLGTSDFIWEDFVRLQYESLIPMLEPPGERRSFTEPTETLRERLQKSLEPACTHDQAVDLLNEFKDREIFLIDLDHIVGGASDFRLLSERLTQLCEVVVDKAAELALARLVERFGKPGTVAGLESRPAILGLGKLGGAALGYASDIELLFVYSDQGKTDGEDPISNAEFFERFAQATCHNIRAKREGIFNVDLRLRPWGQSGPLACSLESFCRYFEPGGPAHSFERLALVRLRAVAGDRELGQRVERLRDEMIYTVRSIDVGELRELRAKQLKEKVAPGEVNAKFSPGALVDLEYDVQILQVLHGSALSDLRTPLLNQALSRLARAGVLKKEQAGELRAAHEFFRRLINGLRMLRGNARDLILPPVESDEFEHLARRMGYNPGPGLAPARQLRLDFDTHTAAVRAFVEWDFGVGGQAGRAPGNAADLVLSAEEVPPEVRDDILRTYGFKDTERAYGNLKILAGDEERRPVFARLVLLACDILRRQPDPDRALNNWARFVMQGEGRAERYRALFFQPTRLEIILGIFASSQFLADTLIKNPGFLDWVTVPENLQRTRSREEIEAELRVLSGIRWDDDEWLDELRRFRRREMLRIGTRDICLGISTRIIMFELSELAEAVVHMALDRIWSRLKMERELLWGVEEPTAHFCVMGFGKLGGQELNYSSDIDLVAFCDRREGDRGESLFEEERREEEDIFVAAMKRLGAALSTHTDEGYTYRVDLRLRPYGRHGELVYTIDQLVRYYEKTAKLWEIQALLKARPVAGNLQLGQRFFDRVRPLLLKRLGRAAIVGSIDTMRQAVMKLNLSTNPETKNIKTGIGGIRDVEFMVQGLQLIHAADHPSLLTGNTLNALAALSRVGIVPEELAGRLADDYIFLRKVEHYLQILEDQQTHVLPRDRDELGALARRMLGSDCSVEQFNRRLDQCRQRVREAYLRYLLEEHRTGETGR